jgi:hypothetical protein
MSLLIHATHHVIHEAVKHVEEKNRREAEAREDARRAVIENNKKSLTKRIEGFIELDIPIPRQYIWDYPDMVVETALHLERRDLVSDMLLPYEQRRLARLAAHSAQKRTERRDRWLLRLTKLTLLLFIGWVVYEVAIR